MKKIILLILSVINISLSAQVITAVAPLKPGNIWVYSSSEVFQSSRLKFKVTDSVKIINGISFFMQFLPGEI